MAVWVIASWLCGSMASVYVAEGWMDICLDYYVTLCVYLGNCVVRWLHNWVAGWLVVTWLHGWMIVWLDDCMAE